MSRFWSFVGIALIAVGSSLSCAPYAARTSAHTHVARGELYRTGQPVLDEYFKLVHALQVEVHGFDDDRRAARSGLVSALGLLPGTPAERIVEVCRARIGELRRNGAVFSMVGGQVRAQGPQDAQTLAAQANQLFMQERAIVDAASRVPARATSLLEMHDHLNSEVDKQVAPQRRDEVRRELKGAQFVLSRMRDAAPQIALASERFLHDLRAVFSSQDVPVATSSSESSPAARPSSAKAGSAASSAAPRAIPKKPTARDDVNP